MNISLRSRIAVFFVLTTGLLLAVVFIVLFIMVSQSLYRHLDADLDGEISEVSRNIVVLSGQFVITNQFEWKEGEHKQIEMNPVFLQIVDSVGNVVRRSDNLQNDMIPYDSSASEKRYFNTSISRQPVRGIQVAIQSSSNKRLGIVVIAVPRKQTELVLADLKMFLLIIYPLSLFLLFLMSRRIAGRSLVPVQMMISTAQRITRENLAVRIELPPNRDELHTLASTINDLLERIEAALTRERQLTADVAHELRTPLAALKGTMEVLIRKPRTQEHYEDKVSYCIGEVNRLSALVDQVLMLARFESGAVHPTFVTVELSIPIRNVTARLAPLFAEKSIRCVFTPRDIYHVRADQMLLENMLENVLSNAAKYSHTGGVIEIHPSAEADEIRCRIRDSGIGMNAEQIKNAFNRFYRAEESRTSEIPGSGLGLAIVKKLAELQNIAITVESAPEEGTTFTFVFTSPSAVPDRLEES
jgi:heavy metal sensor kinase